MTDPQPQPVEEVRIGVVKAAIWRNATEDGGFFYNATFSRLYRTEEEDWRSTRSFGGRDLLLLAKVADAAHTRILALRSAGEEDADE